MPGDRVKTNFIQFEILVLETKLIYLWFTNFKFLRGKDLKILKFLYSHIFLCTQNFLKKHTFLL